MRTHTNNLHPKKDINEEKTNISPSGSSSTNVILDKEDADGFDVDWDAIEKNYKIARQKRHRHHSSSAQSNTPDEQKTSNTAHKKWSRKKKIFIGILLFFLCIIIGTVAAFLILRYNGKQKMLNYNNLNINVPENVDYEDGGRVIYYKDHKYLFNSNIATILFMGIDNTQLKENAVSGTAGQADALYLFTYNTLSGSIKVLCLNRDTMTDISRFDAEGNYYDTSFKQLCLAYAYGDGKKLSAENQVIATQRLIYNIPINAYYAIDLSAIKILNDDIGGVTLTPEYTFGDFTKGEQITIKGDMAESFVRHRDVTLVDDNLRRMACQRQYLNAFASQIVPAIRNDFGIPFDLYRDTADYTVTNIDISSLTYLASSLAFRYSGLNLVTIDGEYQMAEGDNSAEFNINKTKLFETILDTFYTQIN